MGTSLGRGAYLALEAVVAMDVVLADGRCLYVSSGEHPEIFRGFRGAADSFGIVARFYLCMVPAPDSVTVSRMILR